MAKREEYIRKVTTTGETGTYYVTLPKEIVRNLKWRKGQNVIVFQKGKKLIVKNSFA